MKNTKGLSRRTMLKGAAATIGIGALGYGLYRTGVFQGQSKSPEDVPAAPISKNKHPVSGVEVSALGMGCMRFPMQPGSSSPRGPEIDEDAAFKLVDYALESGINYFDTAYFYHGGASEAVLGRALARHPRERYLVADKMPGRIIESLSHAKEVFKGQLAKLKTDSIDFYQLHAVMGVPDYQKIYEEYGVLDFLLEQREKGLIKHLGWSFHGDVEALEYLLSRDVRWDYAMLQLNYHDLLHKLVMPERRAKIIGLDKQPAPAHWMYEKVRDAGIPIVVMEPLLGGRLARLSRTRKARGSRRRRSERVLQCSYRWKYKIDYWSGQKSREDTIEYQPQGCVCAESVSVCTDAVCSHDMRCGAHAEALRDCVADASDLHHFQACRRAYHTDDDNDG